MKRNSKFLLLLALIMSGIIGVYFISCGGDETTIIQSDPDRVIGSVHGVVTNDIDNTPLPGVVVTWVNKGETHSTTSDTLGYFVTDGVLGSGDYEFTFSVNGYSVRRATTVIPDIDSLRGEPGTPVSGDIPFSRQLDIDLFPLNATVTGRVFTALPNPASAKETETPLTADGPPASAAPNVPVHIRFDTLYPYYWYDEGAQGKDDQQEQALNGDPIPLNISPNDYVTTTNTSGVYEFLNLPAVTGGWIMIYTDPYPGGGDTLYRSETTFVQLLPNVSVTAPDIYTPVAGDMARVIQTNFETGKFPLAQNLEVDFSDKMDTAKVEISLTANCPPSSLSFGISWSDENRHLTIDPTFDLVPDCFYQIGITGTASNGNPLLSFTKTFATIDGMRFVSTNLDDYSGTPGSFLDFPLDENIDLCFDMVPDLTNPNTSISLIDTLSGQQVDNSASVNGNCVVIDPSNPLESNRTYRLYFNIYSTLSVDDYVPDSEVLPGAAPLIITVECTEAVPGPVTVFELDSPDADVIDWNTTELTFKWNVVPEADEYQIYAKDNHKNTDFTRVATIPAVDYVTWQTGEVDFFLEVANWQFDLYVDDDYDTTLVTGEEIIFSNGDTLKGPGDFKVPLITPFSDSNAITFQVRAVNTCHGGQYGPFSSSVTLEDEIAPVFTLSQSGNSDQVGKAGSGITIDITGTFDNMIEYAEYMDPTFEFIEGGGSLDPAPSPVTWEWNNTIRDGDATFTVPTGTAAAGDYLVVSIADNSGNVGVDTFRLLPWFNFIVPVADSGLEAGDDDVKWITKIADSDDIVEVHVWLSFDGGATWFDSTETPFSNTPASGDTVVFDEFNLDDTMMFDNTALVRVQDAAGGVYWHTDTFTISGIMMTGPPEDYSPDTVEVFDRGVTDSTTVPLTWDYVGINDVIIQYYAETPNKSLPINPEWTDDITVSNTGSFNWYPPQWVPEPEKAASIGPPYLTYRCWVRVADADLNMVDVNDRDKRPADDNEFSFIVYHDMVQYVDPFFGADAKGGEQYNIRWYNKLDENQIAIYDTLPSILGIDYAVVPYGDPCDDPEALDESDWINLDAAAPNEGGYAWLKVPWTTPTECAYVRIQDAADSNYYSPRFTITGVIVDVPDAGDDWDVGSWQTIQWTTVGNFGDLGETVDIDYWDSGAGQWKDIDDDVLASAGGLDWLVPNIPDSLTRIRVQHTDSLIYDSSDIFTIAGYKILTPPPPDTLYVSDLQDLTWVTIGDPDGDALILVEYGYGAVPPTSWTAFAVNNPTANDGTYSFTVPDIAPPGSPEPDFFLRISANAGTATDTSAKLTVATPYIEVTQPNSNDVLPDSAWMMATTETIEWNSIGLALPQTVTIQLQEWDAGQGIWVLYTEIATVIPSPNGDGHSYDWDIDILLDNVDMLGVRIRIFGTNVIPDAPGALEGFSELFDIETNPNPPSPPTSTINEEEH